LIKRIATPLSSNLIGRAAIAEPAVEKEPAVIEQAPQETHVRTCLIVDDSRVVRRVSRQILESVGYQVTEAENGQEALARCKADMPDLVILDWEMPVMSGIEFITALRALDSTRRPKAMFCTSKGESNDIYKGIEAGADEYVTKPFTAESLKAKLERIGAI
jgi:two-component system, chemotaxis family, chemotaxis protein CheY